MADQEPVPADHTAVNRPDLRFALASERTLLAYQRTAIALIVAAIGFAHFLDTGALLMSLCLLLVFAGAVAAIGGHVRFLAVNKAIQDGDPMPTSPVPILLTTALAAATVVAVIMVVTNAG